MSKLTTILSSAALLVASNAAVKADELLAGPLPVDPGFGTGTITCLATNASVAAEQVGIVIIDANGNPIQPFECTLPGFGASCSTAVTVSPNDSPVPPSPYICRIASSPLTGTAPAIRGSICGTVDNLTGSSPGSTYCLQALINNNSSNGWTCGSTSRCTNP